MDRTEEKERILYNATPGLNCAIIHNECTKKTSEGLMQKYFFEHNRLIKNEVQTNLNVLYDIASLTKVVCTVPVIFRLYEKNKLKLTDKVRNYLPEFKYDDVTIYDLLTHTSGLASGFSERKIISRAAAMVNLYDVEQVVKKGEFLYSDIGYMFLGLIAEEITGKKLDKVFEEEVAIPLNMISTGFNPTNKDMCAPTEIKEDRGMVQGEVHDEKANSLGGVAGHAGLFSNIDDLCNFVDMIRNDGIYENKRYLSKESIDTWSLPLVKDKKYYRSFSWFVGTNPNIINNKYALSFSGFTGCSISIDKKNDVSIIMLTNRIHPTRDNRLMLDIRPILHHQIYDNLDILNKSKQKHYNE